MKSPGEDIRTARNIYACLYGEESVWQEVSVMLWMREAEQVRKHLRLGTLQETLDQVRTIPINILILK